MDLMILHILTDVPNKNASGGLDGSNLRNT